MKLLREAKAIWAELEAVATSEPQITGETLESFKRVRERFEPHWNNLYLITSKLLTVEYVTDAELGRLPTITEEGRGSRRMS